MSSKVVVYSKPDCSGCMMTKNWLNGNDTEFEEVSIMGNKEALDHIKKDLGFSGLPVVEIEGHEPFVGFQPDLLKEYLG